MTVRHAEQRKSGNASSPNALTRRAEVEGYVRKRRDTEGSVLAALTIES